MMHLHFHKLIVGCLSCPVTNQPSEQRPPHLLDHMCNSCKPFCQHLFHNRLQLHVHCTLSTALALSKWHTAFVVQHAGNLHTHHSWSLPILICQQFVFIQKLVIITICSKSPTHLLVLLLWPQGDCCLCSNSILWLIRCNLQFRRAMTPAVLAMQIFQQMTHPHNLRRYVALELFG